MEIANQSYLLKDEATRIVRLLWEKIRSVSEIWRHMRQLPELESKEASLLQEIIAQLNQSSNAFTREKEFAQKPHS